MGRVAAVVVVGFQAHGSSVVGFSVVGFNVHEFSSVVGSDVTVVVIVVEVVVVVIVIGFNGLEVVGFVVDSVSIGWFGNDGICGPSVG